MDYMDEFVHWEVMLRSPKSSLAMAGVFTVIITVFSIAIRGKK